MEGGCCDHAHDDVDVANDPTLLSCCEKDQLAFDRAMELKRVLTEHDPTSQNVLRRQQVVLPPPEPTAPPCSSSSAAQAQAASAAAAIADKLRAMEVHSDDDDSDLDLDDDMDRLLAARRQELAAQFETAAKNAADGYGIILETDFAALLKELESRPEIPRVAFVRSNSLDSSLDHDMLTQMLMLATRFVGTKFYSITVSTNDEDAMRQLRVTTAPTIVAFRRGQRVDATAVQEKDLASASASILWEARLVPWLTMCNVLETTRQDQKPGDGPVPLQRTTSLKRGGQDGEEVAFDCGVGGCRIRFAYEHEHVGPSQESKAEISAWRSTPV